MNVTMIGLDLAKNVFQVHGADAAGAVIFRKQLRRDKLLAFFAVQPACIVAMEACSSAHYWAREIGKLGHTIRLIAPAHVRPPGPDPRHQTCFARGESWLGLSEQFRAFR